MRITLPPEGSSQFVFEHFLNKGGGVSIPKLYVKFWWLLFLAMKFTCLFLTFSQNSHFYSEIYQRGGGPSIEEIFVKKKHFFFSASLKGMGRPLARHGHWKASDHTYLLWAQVNSIIVHWAAAYSGLITMITMRTDDHDED